MVLVAAVIAGDGVAAASSSGGVVVAVAPTTVTMICNCNEYCSTLQATVFVGGKSTSKVLSYSAGIDHRSSNTASSLLDMTPT